MLPVLARIHGEYATKGVDILVLNVIPSTPDRDFVTYMKRLGGADFAYATDTKLSIAQDYGVQYLGTLIAVGPNGRVAARLGDAVSYEELKSTVDQLRR